MTYVPHTPEDIAEMLKAIGVKDFEELLKSIPEEIRLEDGLDLPEGLSEIEVLGHIDDLAKKNRAASNSVNFLGGGSYDHFIPAAVASIVGRSEFYTAYTPYQPEVSQGTLQAIYEYQSVICDITGMDVSNASVYDGPTAMNEAMLLALRAQKNRDVIVASEGLHPHTLKIMRTFAEAGGSELVTVPLNEHGRTDLTTLNRVLNDHTAALHFQQPNFFGVLEDGQKLVEKAHKVGALAVTGVYPLSLGVVTPPGHYGADIAVGEGQCLGNHIGYGGPYLGIFTATKKLMRQMPGRIVGETADKDGTRGYVLTLQTREQHIRRGKATSNICTNQGLNALAAVVYLSLLGKEGFNEVSKLCYDKAHYLYDRIIKETRFRPTYDTPFFNEFVLQTPIPAVQVVDRLIENHGILAGVRLDRFYPDLEHSLMIAVTEKRTRAELDRFVDALAEIG